MKIFFNKAIIGSILGNIMEFYDFVIYGYLFCYIGKLFFPTNNEVVTLLLTFATFAGGYLTRPLGAVIFGHIGDKYGRRIALLFSICLITAATFLIGVLPTYDQIGIFAPQILIILRLLQGIAVSGEQAGAVVYVAEFFKMKKLGQISAFMVSGVLIGVFLGCLVVLLCQLLLSDKIMLDWGWRIPFLFSAVLGIASLKYRLELIESPVFNAIKSGNTKSPISKMFATKNLPNCLKMFLLSIIFAVPMSLHNIYLPVYYSKIPAIGLTYGLFISCVGVLWIGILAPIVGVLSEKLGSKQVIVLGCCLLLTVSHPISVLLYYKTIGSVVVAEILFGIILTLLTAPLFAIFVESFPLEIRYTGVAVTFNLGMAIFASMTPVVIIILEQYLVISRWREIKSASNSANFCANIAI